jgi:hypothetical protein
MEINNIPKMPVKISADSHHGVVRFAAAVFVTPVVRRRRAVVFFAFEGLSQ